MLTLPLNLVQTCSYNVVNMKVALIQLSDIHFSSNRDLICSRQEAFCRSCKYLINECSKVIFVISGDIANYGTEEQYNIAYLWLKECENFGSTDIVRG